nr:MAG TPA: hypothetical protein [Bacteriophage sp.]
MNISYKIHLELCSIIISDHLFQFCMGHPIFPN